VRAFWIQLLIIFGIGLVALWLIRVVLKRMARKQGRHDDDTGVIEKIDLATLSERGPPDQGVHLEFYHIPVRLALLVLAPVGREGRLPGTSQLPQLVDQIVPGLMQILEQDQPQFRRWPGQLSTEGFLNTFFSHVSLPGDRGKGTPWCGIAGKFEVAGEQYLVGMVCRARNENSLGHVVVEHSGKWLDVLRVRS
jgi:hypothetical protein